MGFATLGFLLSVLACPQLLQIHREILVELLLPGRENQALSVATVECLCKLF
jgi:hypothetical protein